MAIKLKPGMRLHSTVCTTELVVVRASAESADLRCGGQPVTAHLVDVASRAPAPGFDGGTQLGKRYTDEEATIQLLCVKAGAGSLSIGESVMQVSGAKPLAASD